MVRLWFPMGLTGSVPGSLVIASIIYTYDGWYYAAYFSGEIKGGGGAVARACIKGTVVVIVLYVFLAAALAWKVPLASLAGNELALAGALEIGHLPARVNRRTGCGNNHVAGLPEPAVYGHAPELSRHWRSMALFVRRAGEISKGGNPDLCGGAVLGAFGRPDHDRRIRISASPFRIFLPVFICIADRGSHHPAFAPAGC